MCASYRPIHHSTIKPDRRQLIQTLGNHDQVQRKPVKTGGGDRLPRVDTRCLAFYLFDWERSAKQCSGVAGALTFSNKASRLHCSDCDSRGTCNFSSEKSTPLRCARRRLSSPANLLSSSEAASGSRSGVFRMGYGIQADFDTRFPVLAESRRITRVGFFRLAARVGPFGEFRKTV